MRLCILVAVVLTASVAYGQTVRLREDYSFRTEVDSLNPNRATTILPDKTIINHERDSTGTWTHRVYAPPQPRPKTPAQIQAEQNRQAYQMWLGAQKRKPKPWWRKPRF